MTSRYAVSLNNIALSSLSNKILILDVQYSSPEMRTDTLTLAKRHGARVYRQYIAGSSVTILFEIHEYGISQRQSILDSVNNWAKNGGALETNDRTGQQLKCVCTSFPAITSVRGWTEPLSITFSAYELPFWTEKNAVTLTLTGTSDSGTLLVPGNFDSALVEAEITTNAALSSVSLTVNGQTLSLTDLSIASGSVITISYDEKMIQSIKVSGVSLFPNRSGVDDLLAKCGENNIISISASADVTVVFSVKGVWL